MKALLAHMQEEAGRLNEEALRLENIRSGLEQILKDLSGESPLDTVRRGLVRENEALGEQLRVLKQMSAVLNAAHGRYGRAQIHIIDKYDEADTAMPAVQYKEFRVPESYFKALEGL